MAGLMGAGRSVASYRAIADDLMQEIGSGEIEVGSLLPTERELQARFQAGRSVVRRALAQVVQEGWGQAIPNRGVIATKPRNKPTTTNVAFVDHRNSFNQNLFIRLVRTLQTHGYHLVLVDSQDLGVEGALEYAADQGFAAAFVWSKAGYPDPARIRRVMDRMPIIALDHSLKTVTTDLVADDNFEAARTAVDHLVKQGRRRIAITGFYDMSETHHDRFSGYLVELFVNGIQPLPRNFLFTATSNMEEADTLLLDRRLKDDDRPDALLVLQDEHTPFIIDSIHRAGLQVPDDLAVVAFRDDIVPVIGDVALTTVAVDWDAYVDVCIQRLIHRLESPDLAYETIRLPIRLQVRGSCGAPCEKKGHANLPKNNVFATVT